MKPLIDKTIRKRIKSFESLGKKSSKEWFSELCFCILTANSKAQTAINIQKEIGAKGFIELSEAKLAEVIQKNKHRFHNNKARFIVLARKHIDVKSKLRSIEKKYGTFAMREWLVRNVKGIGYKEASHFLRNVGYKDFAILDRHILNQMADDGIIVRPKTLTKKTYLNIERRFLDLAKKHRMDGASFDLFLWQKKTGKILK